jgi:apolipoprotein N-acyltransferase
MKTPIKVLFIVMAILQLGLLNAQQGQRPTKEEWAKRETENMKGVLALNDSQVVKYNKIALKYAGLQTDIWQHQSIDRDEKRKKMTELTDQKKEEVKLIITPEQFAKYEKWLQENQGRMGSGNRGGGNSQQQLQSRVQQQ